MTEREVRRADLHPGPQQDEAHDSAASEPRLPDNPTGINLAAAWYVACSGGQVRSKPLRRQLFGREVVLWRDGTGAVHCMSAFCPHQGAHLGLGDVVDGQLRCPFHHWRFDGEGRCAGIPGEDRIPTTARVATYPVQEAYGYVWVWWGSAAPLMALPDFPPLTSDRGSYLGFTYDDRTRGTARHLLENAVDYQHFSALHGLDLDDVEFTVLSDPAQAADNGLPIPEDAWFGVRFAGRPRRDSWPARVVATASTFAMGGRMELLVDGWPAGQRFTAYVDGREVYKVLMALVPESDRSTRQVGWAGVRRTGRWPRTLFNLVLFYVQNRVGTWQDIPIYDSTRTAQPMLYVRYDNGLMRFRRYYQRWVQRAQAAPGRDA